MPSSPTFCTPRGTILGLANAVQKNAITSTAQSIISSIGTVNENEPIVKMGWNSKLGRGYPGAGYPHPEPRWHPSATGARDMKVTLNSSRVQVTSQACPAPGRPPHARSRHSGQRGSGPAVPVDHQPD